MYRTTNTLVAKFANPIRLYDAECLFTNRKILYCPQL